ncbi:MAG TPA: hypothetical protein VMJ34_07010 [Bryobacteraceae bacterium]|nr:hypothetical protein [Bryobacteraceae bacterium]
MLISAFFVLVSLILLAYWFRYTCLLILSAKPARDYAAQVAVTNRLSFPRVQQSLEAGVQPSDLEALCRQLDRDYTLLTCLMRHGAQFREIGQSLEDRMLMLDFAIMKRTFSMRRSVDAVREMANIVQHFANQMGEHAAAMA